MNNSVSAILITCILTIFTFLTFKFYKNSLSKTHQKLSYKERVFLLANLDVELENENLNNKLALAGNRETKTGSKSMIENINLIIKHDSNNMQLAFNKGLSKIKILDFKGAIEDFSEVIQNDTTNKYSFYYRGIANLRLSNFTKSINDLTTAINLGMKDKEVNYYRGLAEIEVDKYNEAIDDFNLYLGAHPAALEAFFNRGIAYNKSGNPEFALKDFNKAIDLNPNHEKAYFERAFAKKNLNDLVGYSNDLKTSYNKGYLHAYHFLKET